MWSVYIMSNANRTLYVGIYFESAPSKLAAAKREKQIKGWTRAKKIALIETINPHWRDLNVDCFAVFA